MSIFKDKYKLTSIMPAGRVLALYTIISKILGNITNIFLNNKKLLKKTNINFKLSNFNITGDSIPEIVCDKILKYHIVPMQDVRNELKISIWASKRSGYRPKLWEIAHNRSGDSQHVFIRKGAVDWTCKDFSKNKDEFLKLIIKHTKYTRITVYKTFIHCDYKNIISQRRELYKSGSNSKWKFVKYI